MKIRINKLFFKKLTSGFIASDPDNALKYKYQKTGMPSGISPIRKDRLKK